MANYITIMGIDPGINNCGISITRYYLDTKLRKTIYRTTLHANAEAKKVDKKQSKLYGGVFSLFVFEALIDEIYKKYEPDYICSEDAFYNPRTPGAFVSLKNCIMSIKRVLYKYGKVLYLIAPKAAKAAVCTGTANKEVIQDAILKLPDLQIKDTKESPISEMVEHEADSIAIAYAFTTLILPSLI